MTMAVEERTAAASRQAGELMRRPLALAGRARSEAEGIWDEAHRLARGTAPEERSTDGLHRDPLWGWYAGLGAMAAIGLIQWPMACVITAAHEIERHTHNQMVDELVEGISSGA
jgi:hypothetical protein